MDRMKKKLLSLAVATTAVVALVLGAASCRNDEQQACQTRCEESGAGLGLCFRICDGDCADSEIRFGLSPVACERMQQRGGQAAGG